MLWDILTVRKILISCLYSKKKEQLDRAHNPERSFFTKIEIEIKALLYTQRLT